MRNIILLGCLLFIFGSAVEVQAQLSKKEKKEWKKRKKKMDEEEFKSMFEENSALRGQVNSLKGQITNLQSRVSDKDAKISELTEEIRALEEQAAQTPEPQPVVSAEPTSNYEQGIVFKVQIGAFRNKDLSKYFENTDNFSGETDDNGLQKITLGVFRDYWEADTFKKYLREMGVKDAWIVPFKDGSRVPMKDVLEGVI
ncbi:MAG: Ezrin/radixin/moesin family protein [Candidatus Cyclobacteriaceae bacterium M3_2C_046]